MMFLAFADSCDGLGASGFAFSSADNSEAKAMLPRLAPRLKVKSRRDGEERIAIDSLSIDISELVCIEEGQTDVG